MVAVAWARAWGHTFFEVPSFALKRACNASSIAGGCWRVSLHESVVADLVGPVGVNAGRGGQCDAVGFRGVEHVLVAAYRARV